METTIHPTAVVDESANLGNNVEIGPYAVIKKNVTIGDRTVIHSHAVIECADIGSDCQIFSSAFVGTAPQDMKYRGEDTRLVLGSGSVVRECVTLNRGTSSSGS